MANDSLEQLALHTIGGGWGSETKDATNNIRVSVIRGTDIPRLRVGDFSSVPVRYESGNKVKNRLLKPGDIVIEVSGGSAASGQHTGRALFVTQKIVDSLGGNVIPASFCRLLRLDAERVNPNFIVYQIDALHLTGEISEFENQSTGIANFQFSRFVQETFPCIDDLRPQTTIAHILGTLDDKIELNRKQNETLEAMARALFKAWFVDFEPVRAKMEGRWQRGQSLSGLPAHLYDLFPDRLVESELGEIPEGWEVKAIGDFATVKRGGSPRPIQDFIRPQGLPWVKISDATSAPSRFLFKTKEFIKEDGLKKTVFLKKGALILSNSATPGLPKFLELDACIHDGWLYFPQKQMFSDLYLYELFLVIREELIAQGNGSVFTNLKTDILRAQRVVVATEKLLRTFDDSAQSIFNQLLVLNTESNSLAQLRDTLLPKLISGQLRVSDAERIVGARGYG